MINRNSFRKRADGVERVVGRTEKGDDDPQFVDLALDVSHESIVPRSVSPIEESPEATLLSDGVHRKSAASSSYHELRAVSLKRFSQDLKTFSRELKSELSKRFSPKQTSSNRVIDLKVLGNAKLQHTTPLRRDASGAHQALQGLKFISKTSGPTDQKAWKAVEERFYDLASPEGTLARSDFGQCIGMKDSKEFAGALFDALTRRDGHKVQSITKNELHEYWKQISNQDFDSRLEIFFGMIDKNADGNISEEEVKELIELSASANKLSKLKEQAGEYAALIMEEYDPDNKGYIELWQVELLLRGKEPYRRSQSVYFSQALTQKIPVLPRSKMSVQWRRARYFLEDNWRRVWVIVLWMVAMAALFIWKFIQYRYHAGFAVMGYCLCVAKGAAETLKLNMALILLPVCRNTITRLRITRLNSFVPFDDNLNFHKVIALGVTLGVFLHGVVHLTCDFPRILSSPQAQFQAIQDDFPNNRRPSYLELLGSVVGVTGIIMVVCMAIAFTLATRWFRRGLVKVPPPFTRLTGFNAFWYSHHLFVIVYICLILHGLFLFLSHTWYKKTTWMYVAIPMLIYAGERTLRHLRGTDQSVHVIKAAIYPGNVLSLHFSKPRNFHCKSGQYIFVKCPAVSPFEWHPFSITSAPSDHFVSVHIRTVGDWTNALKGVFQEVLEPPEENKSGLLRADYAIENPARIPKVVIDGPYGAPAQDYKNYDVLLLVGLGIGATPFISILKDMLNNLRLQEQELKSFSPNLKQQTTTMSPRRRKEEPDNKTLDEKKTSSGRGMNGNYSCPNRAYFYWVTREQGSFEWFRRIMNEVAEGDQKGVIEMHNYLTSVYEDGDARSALVTMLQTLNEEKNGVDVLSGTKARTHFARPKWKKVFSKMAVTHKGAKVGVFYCGAPVLATELAALSIEYSRKSTTQFQFHKENF